MRSGSSRSASLSAHRLAERVPVRQDAVAHELLPGAQQFRIAGDAQADVVAVRVELRQAAVAVRTQGNAAGRDAPAQEPALTNRSGR